MTDRAVVKRQLRTERKKKLVESRGGKCERCGESFPYECFDFHHKDPRRKDFTINQDFLTRRPWDVIEAEADKCCLLCSNCHRSVHVHKEDKYFEDTYSRYRDEQSDTRPEQLSLFGSGDDD